MKDIHQITIIIKALKKQRERFLSELFRINTIIKNKQAIIYKMKIYINEYHSETRFNLSKKVPGLFMNLNKFIQQIEDVILKTTIEIEQLQLSREMSLSKIEKNDRKIDLMEVFAERNRVAEKRVEEKLEQIVVDDIAATINLRR